MAVQHDARKSVDRYARGLAQPYSGHLDLLVVGHDPDIRKRDKRNHLGAEADVLTRPDSPLADHAIDRRDDAGVAKSYFGEIARRLLRALRAALACFS